MRKLAGAAAVAMAGFLLVAGLAHTPLGRSIYARAAGDTCPFGGQAMSSAERDAQSRADDQRLRGQGTAPARPALSFELTNARRDAITRWATTAGGRCHDRDQGSTVECADLPLAQLWPDLGPIQGTLWARFDGKDRLREVTAISRVDDAAEAARLLNLVTDRVTSAAGPPLKQTGDASASYLARGALAQAAVEYRFADYYAKVSATNLGQVDGFRIYQSYRALED